MLTFFQNLIELFGQPEWSLIEAHQASTHLPIGLLLGAFLLDIGGKIFRKPALNSAGCWAQMLATYSMLVTLALGFYGNPFAGKSSELGQKADLHSYFAYATLAVFGVLALWRMLRKSRLSKGELVLYVALNLAGIAIIVATGWMGAHIAD